MIICITNLIDYKHIQFKIKLYKVAIEYRLSFVKNFKFYVLRFDIARVYIGLRKPAIIQAMFETVLRIF